MTTLYIIGNGFDLWHELPTDYGSFYEHAGDALDELEAYYVSGSHLGQPWHDFENCLGTYDWELLYDDFNNVDFKSESFRPRDVYGLEDELVEQSKNLVTSVENLFQEWVSDIDVSAADPRMTFDLGSKFLTFNYTDTLQEVYQVSNDDIFHIHGNARAYEKLVFGHGASREEEPETDENGDSNRNMFTDAEGAAKYPFYALKKPVYELIEKNKAYFRSLSGVTNIVIIGHSLNEIDLPYFREISRNTPRCCWVVYCYRENDAEHYKGQLERCGVPVSCIETRTYKEGL